MAGSMTKHYHSASIKVASEGPYESTGEEQPQPHGIIFGGVIFSERGRILRVQ